MAKQYRKKNQAGTFYYKDPEMTIIHRVDGPAAEYANGNKSWYLNGEPHRLDGPAAEYANGNKAWWIGGVFIFAIDKSEKITRRML